MKSAIPFLALSAIALALSGCCQMMPWLCVETKKTVVLPPYQLHGPDPGPQTGEMQEVKVDQ
jgi:hypothetical protein